MKKEIRTFVYPKNPIVLALVKVNKKRSLALSKLKGEKGLCKWCMVVVDKTRKKYCSKECKDSAWAFFYPQKYAYTYLFQRQEGKCAHCGYDFSSKIKKWYYSHGGYNVADNGDVDHIIPIHKGGEILGIENLQLLCRDCHIIKSSNERRKQKLFGKGE